MKLSGLLFLVIALMHRPHEMNCVKIILDGFYPNTPNSRTCGTRVNATGRIILDEGETLENLPPRILLQFKCPYHENFLYRHMKGPKDGSWFLYLTAPLSTCALPAQTGFMRYLIQCWPGTGRTYHLGTHLRMFYVMKNCSLRFFLGETTRINHSSVITNDHGFMGLSRELPLMEFTEAPYYNTSNDEACDKVPKFTILGSSNEASGRQPPTDVLLFVCGLVMASAVLSF